MLLGFFKSPHNWGELPLPKVFLHFFLVAYLLRCTLPPVGPFLYFRRSLDLHGGFTLLLGYFQEGLSLLGFREFIALALTVTLPFVGTTGTPPFFSGFFWYGF